MGVCKTLIGVALIYSVALGSNEKFLKEISPSAHTHQLKRPIKSNNLALFTVKYFY